MFQILEIPRWLLWSGISVTFLIGTAFGLLAFAMLQASRERRELPERIFREEL